MHLKYILNAFHNRSDPVVVDVEGEGRVPAQVVYYFHEAISKRAFALVCWYDIVEERHPIMGVPRVRLRRPALEGSYSCVPIGSIANHAWLPQDFTSDGTYFFWDE